MIQVHELKRVIASRTSRDNWEGGFNNTQAVYDVIFEYDNGQTTTEQVVIPLMAVNRNGRERLNAIRDMLIKEFKEITTEPPSDSMKTYIRKGEND